MQQQVQPQQDKPLQQRELRTVVWQSGMLDVYLATVSNRLNVVMKQLTIIATIFMPITFITGVFGQNFGHLPQVEHDNGYLFWIVLAFMGLITAFQIWYFKKRGWL